MEMYQPYQHINEILRQHTNDVECIFVKGSQKLKFLEQILFDKTIIDISQDKCKLHETLEPCHYHHNCKTPSHCALVNVKSICKYLNLK